VTGYVLRRLLYLVPLLFGVSLVVFVIFDLGLFGDPVAAKLGKYATTESIAQLRHDLGLDRPWFERFGDHLWRTVTLDFGRSSQYRVPIAEMIARGAGPSLAITLPGFLVATTVAVSLSVLCAAFRGRALDRVMLVAAVGLMSVSSVVYIIYGQYYLAYRWEVFKLRGYERGLGAVPYVLLPILIFVFLSIGPDLRFYRAAMVEEVRQDYVRTARAKGLGEVSVLFKHVLRNGLIPILTRVVVELPFLFVGSLLLERYFSIPGLGGITVTAVLTNDMPVIRAMTFFFAVFLVLGTLLTDIAYSLADPRVRLR
jgi:peptide/nickel transport system permease protein